MQSRFNQLQGWNWPHKIREDYVSPIYCAENANVSSTPSDSP